MKRLLILASMLAAPTSAYAQGLPIDFDPQADEAATGASGAQLEVSMGHASQTRVTAARSVRHGEHRTMVIDRSFTGSAGARQAEVASAGS
ncbi:hypothetical protein [Rhizorhabdus argentea]|uniref:hypothetical protein n=1 Tax=Rhizorhabdus argentea TaxID=1387174 RepID=UPI0030ED72EF